MWKTESDATRLLKWLFYAGSGQKYLGYGFPEYQQEDDGCWTKVNDGGPKTWDVPENRIKWSPVDSHLKGAFRGVVRGVGETHLPCVTVDADRHTGEVPAATHISEVVEIGRLLNSRCGRRYNLRWAVEVNPQNGSAKFFGFTGRPIPENTAKDIAEEIHEALISAGLGQREVFPANGPKVFLPCRPDKITIIDSGIVPKVMRRRRHGDPVECYSAVAFWRWVKAGRSYDEDTLIQTLAAACHNLRDAPVDTQNGPVEEETAKPQRTRKTTRTTKIFVFTGLRDEPDSLVRQRDALLVFCRANKRVVSIIEALAFIRQQRLYTGDWNEGLGRRTIRVGQILDFIGHTFDVNKCRSSRPVVTVNLKRFVRWARICDGWRAERTTVDEYGRIMRKRDRTVVGPDFLAVFMAVVEYVLITDRNEDDTVPQERAKAIWDDLYRTGQTNVKYCPRKWAICRNRLESMGVIRIDHTHFHGQAMKWWPTDLFPCQPKEWKAEKVRGMLDPVELGEFLKEKREGEQHNSLLQHLAINGEVLDVWASFPPPARGSPGGISQDHRHIFDDNLFFLAMVSQ